MGWYLLAKLLETFDKPIFALGDIVSGHTLKHPGGGHGGVVDFADGQAEENPSPYLVQLLQAQNFSIVSPGFERRTAVRSQPRSCLESSCEA